jgi:DNA-binding beta-propeller fold protein YncE
VLIAATVAVVPRALHTGSRRVPIAPAAPGMAYVGAEATEQDTVIPVNLRSGVALGAIRLGVKGQIVGLVMTPDRKALYVATVRGQVAPVDLTTGTAGRAISIGGVPMAMAMTPDGRTAYVLEPPYGVAVVNLAAGKLARFIKIPEASAFALTPDGATLYVVNMLGSQVTPLDTATGRLERSIATGTRSRLVSLAISPDGRTVYVAGQQPESRSVAPESILTPISTRTNSAGAPIRLGRFAVAEPVTISPDGRTAYLGSDSGVMPISLRNGTVGEALKLPGQGPYQIVVSPDSKVVYAANGQVGQIYRVEVAGGLPAVPVRLGTAGQWAPGPAVFGSGGKTLYVLSWNEVQTRRTVYVGLLTPVDNATGTPGRSIMLRGVPGYVAFVP